MRAYVCDLTGDTLPGDAIRAAVVEVDETTRFTVVVERREAKGAIWRTGHLSPKAVELITAAAKALAAKARGK